MAYSIKIRQHSHVSNPPKELTILQQRIELVLKEDGRFVVHQWGEPESTWKGCPRKSENPYWQITLRRVRLTKKKPYCGQHPGECIVNPFRGEQNKRNATYLEWDDWVAFHGVINDVLDALGYPADVWSTPMECKGIMWIRKDNKRRYRYDYTETLPRGHVVPLRIWNNGTPDQFEPEKAP